MTLTKNNFGVQPILNSLNRRVISYCAANRMRKWLEFLNHVREEIIITVLYSSPYDHTYPNCQCECHPGTLPGHLSPEGWEEKTSAP
jgi:hypothetical protein